MSHEIKVLQVGTEDFREKYKIPENLIWEVAIPGEDWSLQEKSYNVIWITSPIDAMDGANIWLIAENYRVLCSKTDEVMNCPVLKRLKGHKTILSVSPENTLSVIDHLAKYFFETQYGEKFTPDECEVLVPWLEVAYQGHEALELSGSYGKNFRPIVSWRTTALFRENEPQELWLEYTADEGVELELVVRGVPQGQVASAKKTWRITDGLKTPGAVIIDDERPLWLSFTLRAKGKGNLRIGNLHRRLSRMGTSVLLPGGDKDQDAGREEFFWLYDPGDRRPPLNVYFAGYRNIEGFEGYQMMKDLGSPFLLIADPRLEGGAFYLGSEEYEDKIRTCINRKLEELGFQHDQLILSGMSMGAYGAVYYGADLAPHSIIVGKPLMNLGSVAAGERLLRPGGFPTSLDLVLKMEGALKPENIEHLNNRLWEKLSKASLDKTDFVISYMKNDDYDPDGYPDLIEHLADKEANVYGKGIIGRHNDNIPEVVEWFIKRYKRILERSFGRC